MNWFMTVLRKYAVFEGRARRREYWFFVLFYILISVVLAVVDRILGLYNEAYGMGVLGALFCLGVLIPSIAVGAHSRNVVAAATGVAPSGAGSVAAIGYRSSRMPGESRSH